MKPGHSLRAKLFASIGGILLFVAIVSYVIPEYFITKDLDSATHYIRWVFEQRTEDEKQQLTLFFRALKTGLLKKISIVLSSTVLFSFILGLILLARISKRIIAPITLLADAAKKITEGKYEDLHLPKVGKRRDEVEVLVHSFKEMSKSLAEREKIRGVLNKVVSAQVATELLNSNITLTGEERIVTILFSDIRDFTHLSEGISPDILIGLLNDYMTEMCQVVDATNGVVDKFVGDEIMALYGAPLDLADQAEKALECALEMRNKLLLWNAKKQKEGKITFQVGFGIHTGWVYAGNMGAVSRLNYTVIGANVNLAARLCSAAKPMQILISPETWEKIPNKNKYSVQLVPPLRLKGIDEVVSAYEVIN